MPAEKTKKTTQTRSVKTSPLPGGIPCALLLVRKNGEVRDANDVALELLGLGNRLPERLRLTDLVLPVDHENLRLFMEQVVDEGRAEGFFQIRRGESSVLDRFSGRRAGRKGEWQLAICGMDASRLGEQRLQEREARELKGMERLAGGLAHAFGNLLTSIQGANDLAMMQNDEGQNPRESLTMIHQSVEKAKELVAQLIVFANRHTLEPVRVSANRALRTLEPVLRMLLPDSVSLELQLEPEDRQTIMLADEAAVKRCVTLLVQNAREAMDGRGTIRIHLRREKLTEHAARALRLGAGEYLALRVSDMGPGVPEAQRERIFDPFYTTKLGHVGLGLAVVAVTMFHLGGRAYVEEAPGGGACFQLLLPVATDDAAADTAAGEPMLRQGAGERVLILEDEAELNRFIALAMEKFGYRVWTARNLAEADQKFRQEDGRFQILIADVVLPDGNGFEFAQRMQDRFPGLRVLMTSGHAEVILPAEIMRSRGVVYLRKPFRIGELMDSLGRMLNG